MCARRQCAQQGREHESRARLWRPSRVVQRGDAGFKALPVAAQRFIDASAVCKREIERAKHALAVLDQDDADWAAMRHAMQQLPPAALLHILSEEMTAEQMRMLAGKARCEGAKTKAQLAFAVLLTLSLRASGIKGLPANAEQRIQASPVCVDWLAELAISRLRPDYDDGWCESCACCLIASHARSLPPPSPPPRPRRPPLACAVGKLLPGSYSRHASSSTAPTTQALRSCNALRNRQCKAHRAMHREKHHLTSGHLPQVPR